MEWHIHPEMEGVTDGNGLAEAEELAAVKKWNQNRGNSFLGNEGQPSTEKMKSHAILLKVQWIGT